ncbi:MAG: hypothetical protein QOD32_3208 [Pyrinomonadaceae bacterium]|nr:hypothetical protein [Pyrinomonadaceae bacterium]
MTTSQRRILRNLVFGVAVLFSLACAAGNNGGAKIHAASPGLLPASDEQARVSKDVPEKIDARARYLFYLHGRIVEDKGVRPVSELHGVYEYEKIVETFKGAGFHVISEARAKDTDNKQYASKVVAQIDALLKAGVPPRHITVVGASKGSIIAMYTSSLLKQGEVNFVLIAGCGEQTLKNAELNLHGRVLSIYDASDTGAGTCEKLFARSNGLSRREEVKLGLKLGHGFIYRPLKEWVEPVVAWAKQA